MTKTQKRSITRAVERSTSRQDSFDELILTGQPIGEPAAHSDEAVAEIAALTGEVAELRARLDAECEARQHAEEERSALEQAIDVMQLGVTISALDGTILYSNPADASMHGYGRDELVGRDVGVFSPGGERLPLTREELRGVVGWRRDRLNMAKDGSLFPVHLLSDVLRDAAGEPIAIVTTCEDISERRLAEEALRSAYDQLDRRVAERTATLTEVNARLELEIAERREAERQRETLEAQLRQAQKLEAIGQLTSGIAHDFNNLLTVVLASADLAASVIPSDCGEALEHTSSIKTAAENGAALIRKLLAFARQVELDTKVTDLRKVVRDSQSLLQRAVTADVRLEFEIETPVPPVLADAGAVHQMLLNLVTNARDAMPDGGTIRVQLSERVPPTAVSQGVGSTIPMARIAVSDEGVGMDESTQARIFEPFFSTKAPDIGTGLGLPMVYGLMRQHGGFVHVESAVGAGSTFELYFPRVSEQVPSASSPEDRSDATPRGDGETILLADDEEALCRVTATALGRMGYEVLTAHDGQAALELFRQHRARIQIIVSDLMMPRLSGRGLLDAIRNEGSEIPFLLVTGTHARKPVELAQSGLDVPILLKPWTIDELARRVRQALDERAAA